MLLVSFVALVAAGALVQRASTVSLPGASPPPPAPPKPPSAGPPVLAVKVDNAPAARPPIGVGAADVVYVEPVEAGISRLIAVFGSQYPPVVGPVRSARETDLRLLPQFGRPTLAFSGAAPELLPRLDSAVLRNGSQAREPGAYYRGEGDAPHNLFVRPGGLPAGQPWSPNAPLSFGSAPAGGTPSPHREVRYSNTTVDFQWSAADRRWLVSFDGRPYVAADGGRLGPATVVLQRVPERDSELSDSAGNRTPYVETTGAGRALVLRDGRAFEARWSRPSPEAGTTYTTPSGRPLEFAPGQVWTVLAPE